MVTIRWFHITRALGVLTFLYGLLVDESPERGTIILIGAAAAGFDKVARPNDAGPPPTAKKQSTDSRPEVK